MTYALSPALQAAVFTRLTQDADLDALVAGAIYDAAPVGTPPALYVSLGPEEVREASDKTGRGAVHEFTLSVVSEGAGFLSAKQAAARISDLMIDAPISLSRGRLLGLWFLSAKAGRDSDIRRIDLRFRAQLEDDDLTNGV